MLFFQSLAAIGINREELTNTLTEDLVRIEKKLLAQNRLYNKPSKNDIELIIKVLREYPDVIIEICNYECLYGILADEDARYLDRMRPHTPENAARIRYVVSNYFKDELTAFINESFNTNDWNKLSVLLNFKIFLTTGVMGEIMKKLTGKLEYALELLEKHPGQEVLNSQISCLTQRDLFILLSELDAKYFRMQIQLLLGFIIHNRGFVSEKLFFNQVARAMCSFKPIDKILRSNLNNALQITIIIDNSENNKRVGIIFLFIFVIFGFIFLIAKSGSNTAPQRINFLENENIQYGTLENAACWKEDQKIKMEDFVEARQRPLFYPPNSKKVANNDMYKYRNPFSSELFTQGYVNIKHGGLAHINIFNRTLKQCVVIAYFDQLYDIDRQGYVFKNMDSRKIIYALYIPPADSIQIDYNMSLLRFYMGHDLRNFNTYKGYIYPDSTDAKFARYNSADSMLFSKAFVFDPQTGGKQSQDLVITQPSEHSYFLSWTGIKPLYQFEDWDHQISSEKNNDTPQVEGHTLLLDLKHQNKQKTDENEQAIKAFLDH